MALRAAPGDDVLELRHAAASRAHLLGVGVDAGEGIRLLLEELGLHTDDGVRDLQGTLVAPHVDQRNVPAGLPELREPRGADTLDGVGLRAHGDARVHREEPTRAQDGELLTEHLSGAVLELTSERQSGARVRAVETVGAGQTDRLVVEANPALGDGAGTGEPVHDVVELGDAVEAAVPRVGSLREQLPDGVAHAPVAEGP